MPKVSDDYKERKKASLYESALKCFGEKGYQSTTIDDITAHSQTSKGLFYTYFKSKEELYISLMDERTNHTLSRLNESFKTISSAKEKVHELFSLYKKASLTEEWRNFIRVQIEFWVHSPRLERARDVVTSRYEDLYTGMISRIIEDGKAAGEFKQEIHADVVANLFWAFIDGICMHYSVVGENYAYEAHFKATEEMIMNYILIQPEKQKA
ncbi:TetR/AcrR family transcriptional regulator [Heyndrickxia acidicola]|uniref:TetR/AcrR family transcriptional regulator n=1 Tax=Heyndrickxia acidicola TaxID=209389 RepID=A0ABU6MHD4_9BACI|nr:TetR/AcrR family transcriptional regulator [Heyndrickxia acidicola]MED1204076.1 TetR/AcrR family transcriptional regulator [Heyndrickxia acidicola]